MHYVAHHAAEPLFAAAVADMAGAGWAQHDNPQQAAGARFHGHAHAIGRPVADVGKLLP